MTAETKNSLFLGWAEVTTAHGFFDFVQAKTALGRTVWGVIIAICLVMMGCQLYHNAVEWKTSIEEIPSNSGDIKFPSIVVCNVNRLKWSKAKEFNMTIDLINYMFLNLAMYSRYPLPDYNFSAESEFITWRKSHNFSYMDIFDALGPDIDDMFLGGNRLQLKEFNISTKPIYTYEYGRCQRLEINVTVGMVGSKGGLSLTLDTQGWDYVPLLFNNHAYVGMALQVSYDNRVEVGQWIMLQPGKIITVAMQVVENRIRERQSSLLNPFAILASEPPCVSKPEMLYLPDSEYSTVNCAVECFAVMPIVKKCNCVPYFRHDQYRTCEVEEILTCFYSSKTSGKENTASDTDDNDDPRKTKNISIEDLIKMHKCETRCLRPCFGRSIQSQTGVTIFPSEQQAPELENWLRKGHFDNVRVKDLIALDIYFSSLSIKLVEQYEAMSLDNLISSSGGVIGIWAGMSFLTVFQAVAFLMHYANRRCKEKASISKKKKKPSKQTNSTSC